LKNEPNVSNTVEENSSVYSPVLRNQNALVAVSKGLRALCCGNRFSQIRFQFSNQSTTGLSITLTLTFHNLINLRSTVCIPSCHENQTHNRSYQRWSVRAISCTGTTQSKHKLPQKLFYQTQTAHRPPKSPPAATEWSYLLLLDVFCSERVPLRHCRGRVIGAQRIYCPSRP